MGDPSAKASAALRRALARQKQSTEEPPNDNSVVAALRKSASRLNEVTDKVTDAVGQIEDFLNNECSIGLTASVLLMEEADESGTYTEYLVYNRIGGGFHIGVEQEYKSKVDPERLDGDGMTPFHNCDRELKLRAAAKLPDLVAAIARRVGKMAEDAESASEAAMSLLKELR